MISDRDRDFFLCGGDIDRRVTFPFVLISGLGVGDDCLCCDPGVMFSDEGLRLQLASQPEQEGEDHGAGGCDIEELPEREAFDGADGAGCAVIAVVRDGFCKLQQFVHAAS